MLPSGCLCHPRAYRQVVGAPAAASIEMVKKLMNLWPAAAAYWGEGWSREGTSSQHHQHCEWRRRAGALFIRRA